MALVLCQRHGRQGASFICPHLLDAMEQRQPLPEVYYVDAYYLGDPAWGHNLCPACAHESGITEKRTIWKDDESLDRLLGLNRHVMPICARCFDEAKAGPPQRADSPV